MYYNSPELENLLKKYGVIPIQVLFSSGMLSRSDIFNNRQRANTETEDFLESIGYQWDEKFKSYFKDRKIQCVTYITNKVYPDGVYLWFFENVCKVLHQIDLNVWLVNNVNNFIDEFWKLTGIIKPQPLSKDQDKPTAPSSNMGGISPSNKNLNKTTTDIDKIIKEIPPGSHMSSDEIINLYKKAKETQNTKLMDLVKTLKLKESIKKSELKKIIKEIVTGIFKEMTTTGAVSPVSTPKAFSKKSLKQEDEEEKLDEMTTTGDVSGYNIPSAFSRKGGSKRGVDGSSKLGYDLTPIGKKEMERPGDKL